MFHPDHNPPYWHYIGAPNEILDQPTDKECILQANGSLTWTDEAVFTSVRALMRVELTTLREALMASRVWAHVGLLTWGTVLLFLT